MYVLTFVLTHSKAIFWTLVSFEHFTEKKNMMEFI